MDNQQLVKNVLYFILYRLMDVEEIMWNIAEFIIKPVVIVRRKVAEAISKAGQSGQ